MVSKRTSEGSGSSRELATPESPHARAILTVEERIARIVDLMERFEWVRGRTAGVLAAEWGLSQSTVENYSAEAHRRIVGDKDEAIRDITAGARKLFRQMVDMGDARSAKAIGDLWADIAGAKAPARQEIAAAIVDASEATPSKAREIMRGLFASQAAPDKQAKAEDLADDATDSEPDGIA